VTHPRVLVLQSFRTEAVPRWIERCIESVRDWATANGWEHRLLGDELFDTVPEWFASKLGGNLVPMSDLARIETMLRCFATEPWDRIVWVDADVLVFAPERLRIPDLRRPQLVRELWIGHLPGGYVVEEKVNNSVIACVGGDSELAALRDETIEAIRQSQKPDQLDAGTRMLTARQAVRPLPLLDAVGCFGPLVIRDLEAGGGEALDLLLEACEVPPAAANLCRSLGENEGELGMVTEAGFERSVDVLLGTGNPIAAAFERGGPSLAV